MNRPLSSDVLTQQPIKRTDWTIVLLLFVGLSSIYFATASGITSSNDGSHYALTRTMVENRSFALRQFDDFAEGNDIAVREGIVYSDRPPGTAVISTIFYTLGSLLPDPLSTLPSRHDAENPRLLYVLLLPIFSGAGTAVLLYLFLRENGVSLAGALTAVLMFGLGTVHWKYSSVLFSHALSGFLIMLSILLAARFLPTQKRTRWMYFFLLGLFLGLSVLVEYANGLFVILVLLFVLVRERPTSARHFLAKLILLGLGGLISAVFLSIYNQANFGSPFTLSYAYAVNYPWAGDFRTTFSWPLLPGLKALLVGGEGGGWCDPTCYNQGLFLLSPLLLLALPGLPLYYRRAHRLFLLTTTIFLVYLLLFAKHFTFHGFTGDGRYLTPFLPLFAIPLAYSLEWLFNQSRHPAWQTALLFITFGLFFLSVRSMLLHIGFSFNYHLDLSQLDPMIASPQNWRYLVSTLFPNTGNLLLLWLLEGFGVLIWFSGHRIRNLSTK